MHLPKYKRLMAMMDPLPVFGQMVLPSNRKMLWKNVCLLGNDKRECLVEMSQTKLKFYIVALDLQVDKFHVLELWHK